VATTLDTVIHAPERLRTVNKGAPRTGLPGLLLALRRKAREGHSEAKALLILILMASPEARRLKKLLKAALLASGFKPAPPSEPNTFDWPGPGKPPTMQGAALIDWFQRTHPREVRAIEESLRDETVFTPQESEGLRQTNPEARAAAARQIAERMTTAELERLIDEA
jgi:hypothetical protein